MNRAVLVDSSAWIEVTRGRGAKADTLRSLVNGLLEENRAAMTAPVWLELYQGIRGKQEETDLAELRELCLWLDFDVACWDQAAKTARLCLRRGFNVPQGDILVHACGQRYEAKILHSDRHFDLIDKASG